MRTAVKITDLTTIRPQLQETDDESKRVFQEFDSHEDFLAFKSTNELVVKSDAGNSSSPSTSVSNLNTLLERWCRALSSTYGPLCRAETT